MVQLHLSDPRTVGALMQKRTTFHRSLLAFTVTLDYNGSSKHVLNLQNQVRRLWKYESLRKAFQRCAWWRDKVAHSANGFLLLPVMSILSGTTASPLFLFPRIYRRSDCIPSSCSTRWMLSSRRRALLPRGTAIRSTQWCRKSRSSAAAFVSTSASKRTFWRNNSLAVTFSEWQYKGFRFRTQTSSIHDWPIYGKLEQLPFFDSVIIKIGMGCKPDWQKRPLGGPIFIPNHYLMISG